MESVLANVFCRQNNIFNAKGHLPKPSLKMSSHMSWLGKYVNIAYNIGCIPFYWNREKFLFSKSKYGLYNVLPILSGVFIILATLQLASTIQRSDLQIIDVAILTQTFVVWNIQVITGLAAYSMSTRGQQVQMVLNGLLSKTIEYPKGGAIVKHGTKETNHQELEAWLAKYILPIMMLPAFVVSFQQNIYILPEISLTGFIVHWVLRLSHAVVIFDLVFVTHLIWVYGLIIFVRIFYWLHTIRVTKGNLRYKIKILNRMSLLFISYQDSILAVGYPLAITSLSFAVIVCTSGAIKLHDDIEFSLYAIFPLFSIIYSVALALMLSFFGNLWKSSVLALKTLNSDIVTLSERNEGVFYRKVVRALQPFGMRLGPLRHIRHDGAFEYYNALVNWVVTCLIMFD